MNAAPLGFLMLIVIFGGGIIAGIRRPLSTPRPKARPIVVRGPRVRGPYVRGPYVRGPRYGRR
jgi:hypothetical protein